VGGGGGGRREVAGGAAARAVPRRTCREWSFPDRILLVVRAAGSGCCSGWHGRTAGSCCQGMSSSAKWVPDRANPSNSAIRLPKRTHGKNFPATKIETRSFRAKRSPRKTSRSEDCRHTRRRIPSQFRHPATWQQKKLRRLPFFPVASLPVPYVGAGPPARRSLTKPPLRQRQYGVRYSTSCAVGPRFPKSFRLAAAPLEPAA